MKRVRIDRNKNAEIKMDYYVIKSRGLYYKQHGTRTLWVAHLEEATRFLKTSDMGWLNFPVHPDNIKRIVVTEEEYN